MSILGELHQVDSGVLKTIPGFTMKNSCQHFNIILYKNVWISDNLGPPPCNHGLINSLWSLFSFDCGLTSHGWQPTGIEHACQGGLIIPIPMILISTSSLIRIVGNYQKDIEPSLEKLPWDSKEISTMEASVICLEAHNCIILNIFHKFWNSISFSVKWE